MTYPSPTTINASEGFISFLNYINYVTDGWVSNLLLLAIWIIVLLGYYKARDDFKEALAVAGFGTFIIALFFWVGGFVSGWALTISIAMGIIGVIPLMIDN